MRVTSFTGLATGSSALGSESLTLWAMQAPETSPPPAPPPSLGRAIGWSAMSFVALLVASIAACSGGTAAAQVGAPAGPVKVTLLAANLSRPWGLAFLPDGRMLVTQKGGSMVIVRADGTAVDATLSGVPAVNSSGQGGLLDVALDRTSVV